MTSRGRTQAWISVTSVRAGGSTLALAILWVLFAVQTTQAQTFTILHNFTGGADGSEPVTGLFRDGGGNLYGTTIAGGTFNLGTVFKIDKRGQETILHSFAGGADGASPRSLLRDHEGNLLGVTLAGGTAEAGTVFKIDKTGLETVVHAFTGGADGAAPSSPLVLDKTGNLYGSAVTGGDFTCNAPYGCGVVFKIDSSGNETVLYAFTGGIGDGSFPSGNLALDNKGILYGTTNAGGSMSDGTIFAVNTADGAERLLFQDFGKYAFQPSGVIRDGKGNLYGTTRFGGILHGPGCQSFGCGTVFELQANGYLHVLHNFSKATEGAFPEGLLRDKTGNLYGVAVGGGTGGCRAMGCGTVFAVDPTGDFALLHTFTGGADGASPEGVLIRDAQGNLYGIAGQGGTSNKGVVFEITP